MRGIFPSSYRLPRSTLSPQNRYGDSALGSRRADSHNHGTGGWSGRNSQCVYS